MEINLDDEVYKINIIKKNNKNTYIRVKKDLEIYVTTNYLISNHQVKTLVEKSIPQIKKMINFQKERNERLNKFYYLGAEYKIIICNTIKKVLIDEDRIYIDDYKKLDKFLKKQSIGVFKDRLEKNYNKFEEKIPFPELKVRKMKAKWGHCNKRDGIITLNTELIKYSEDEIDYVIIHELCHLLEFNHSPNFWQYIKKYKPDYKKNKKVLKEG